MIQRKNVVKKTDKDTEEIILNAAKMIFLKRGYHGTRMQDIADEAGINKAMLHYYFRNKDKLFQKIFFEMFSKLLVNIQSVLSAELSFDKKIENFVRSYIDIIDENPFIPAFILHELNHNIERLEYFVNDVTAKISPAFLDELEEQMDKGKIKKANPALFIVNILGVCIFPYVARPLLSRIFDFDDESFRKFNEERKDILPDLLLNGMKVK